jgi:hypothetical protein
MTPIQLRTKWRIALASNFFKPNSLYLRELILGNQFTYSFSPMGVLCQVSQLGDFIEDRVPGWLGEQTRRYATDKIHIINRRSLRRNTLHPSNN